MAAGRSLPSRHDRLCESAVQCRVVVTDLKVSSLPSAEIWADASRLMNCILPFATDAVIVDYFVPEMNRQELAIRTRRLKPQAPIIMLSAVVGIPKQALKLVNTFVPKDRLASHLLPAIAQFYEHHSITLRSYDV